MLPTTELTTLSIDGEITTSSQGIGRLMQFFHEASQYRNQTLNIDFTNLTWIDANLTALIDANSYRLKAENNIDFCTDFDFLAQRFNVLFRNGWLKHDDYKMDDDKKTTLPCIHFQPNEKENFCHYIDNELMVHRGMPKLPASLVKRIKADLIEIFTNIYRHAKSTDPFFVCGQYYPKMNYLVFTMVDLGVGFLEPIKNFTGNQIQSDIEAIRWALEGNSTQVKLPDDIGGIGLQSIHDYCLVNKGVFQIYTGTDFWGTDLEATIWRGSRTLNHGFKGSLLNLFFNTDR